MSRRAELQALFQGVDLPEVTGLDLAAMTPAEIVSLLPAYGGKHPMKGILVDRQTGKAYGLASGFEPETVTHNGIAFKSGAISPEVAARAGRSWRLLGAHLEAVAAAFMRQRGVREAVVYINGRNPCWGSSKDPGCYWRLPEFLEEEATMTLYNKEGFDYSSARPDRKFNFVGLPDREDGGETWSVGN